MRANVARVILLSVVVAAALSCLSCESPSGVGFGVDYGARWGGGAGGPGVMVGGPTP
jgi:hypothetical protein